MYLNFAISEALQHVQSFVPIVVKLVHIWYIPNSLNQGVNDTMHMCTPVTVMYLPANLKHMQSHPTNHRYNFK